MLPTQSTRLNKYISESGICSRREADRYIEQGNVFLNGKRATIGDQWYWRCGESEWSGHRTA